MNKSEIAIKNMSEITKYARVFLDGKLHTEDRMAFEINKIILSNKSLYFEMLFYGPFCNKTEFFIPGITGECLHEILRYFYTGKISLNKENVIEILMASDYLMISELRTVVRENVKYTLTIENALQILTLSDLLHDTVIYHESFRFTQLNFEEIMSTQEDDFTNVSFGILKSLLSAKNISIDTEKSIWLAIQKWIEKRKSERKRHVPLLLTCLALEDLDENTVTEITGHDLIVNNSHVKKLNLSDYPSSGNHDRLKSIILKNNPHLIKDVFKSRIPEQLYIIGIGVAVVANRYFSGPYQLYVTYDEKLDVWRKICDIDSHISRYLGVHLYNFQKNLYAFNAVQNWKVDLRNGVSERFHDQDFRSITQIKNKLYFLHNPDFRYVMYTFKIYDCNTDSWTEDTRMFKMNTGYCVSIDECIYVVGYVRNTGVMTAYVYDTTPPRWFDFRALLFPQSRVKKLPSPTVLRNFMFQVVAYRRKIFVIGGRNPDGKTLRSVEAFDVESHTWNQLEDLPFGYWSHFELHATVLNDRLFVYHSSYETNSKIAVWNDHLEMWARIEVKNDLVTTPKWDLEGFEMHIRSIRKIRRQKEKSLLLHDFCTIKDKGAISALCRANRRLPFERSRFSEKDTFQQDWFVK